MLGHSPLVIGIHIGLARRIKLKQINAEVDRMHCGYVNVPLASPQDAIGVLMQKLEPAAHTENRQRIAQRMIQQCVFSAITQLATAQIIATGEDKTIKLPFPDVICNSLAEVGQRHPKDIW